MGHFEEKQNFDQWWLISIISLAEAGIIYGLFQETSGFSQIEDPLRILFAILSMILLLTIFLFRLHTRISSAGVVATFHPFPFLTRKFEWNEIDRIYVRRYSPISEYGGWGIRGLFPAKAYNVSGYYGIQIVTKDDHNFLIGTQKPEEVKKVLKKLNKPENKN